MTGIPAWATKEFFTDVLCDKFNDKTINILEYDCKPAVPSGENYVADIIRTTIRYQTEENNKANTISIILKCVPNDEMMNALINVVNVFETESDAYMNIIPTIHKTLKNSEIIAAECYYYNRKHAIILEDLTISNFKMYPRIQGLDLDHCLMAVSKLACIHATSFALTEENPSLYSHYTEGLFLEVHDFVRSWLASGYTALINACNSWPGYEKYTEKLKRIEERQFEKVLVAKRIPTDFKVLNHGDCWVNNMLFLYDSNGKVKDLRFVDFQFIIYGTAAIDLHYFWATSPNVEVRKNNFDMIFDHYYKKLTQILEQLGCTKNAPSKKQLLADFQSAAFYGLAAAIMILPVVTAPTKNGINLGDFAGHAKDDFQFRAYNNNRYRSQMEIMLPALDNLGVFD